MVVSMRLVFTIVIRLCLTAAILLPVVVHGQVADDNGEGELDATMLTTLAAKSVTEGNPGRGAVVYASPTSACLSCHKVGRHGGDVGPDLSKIASQRSLPEIIESLWSPQRTVAEPYRAIAILTSDGQVFRGYRVAETEDKIEIRDTASGQLRSIMQEEIEGIQEVGSLMPTGLLATMSPQDKVDLIAFISELGPHRRISVEAIDSLFSHAQSHHPESFDMPREPLEPAQLAELASAGQP